ncbi:MULTISPECIES: hypothetical protein [unclassified Lysobacter]|uniref:hypothetical protein n=1 Tax=unclassified Lysobacter TaxID=2635362 RepID=UPI001BE5603D|nr:MULTISPECIES: hypothetical protein [unclassified Lysobacter]MBT2747510.1 hypothetical protein [Lysobacter sp. ISL-42]MBT2752333.1 hypothetical protein [Lysobacter sp. ISL-50]MBT2776248.1 hypothetical protein [Lysobacter sp. ISL-54]MBT2784083.1 hypothetical protein [Lysobacter sp. ISL-52]
MKAWTRNTRLAAVALAVFGFGASLSALAGDEAQCERCRFEYEHCLLTAESPNQASGCETRFAACVRTLDCPVMEI